MGRRDIDRMLWAVGEARRLRLAGVSAPVQVALEPVEGVSPVTGNRAQGPEARSTSSTILGRSMKITG